MTNTNKPPDVIYVEFFVIEEHHVAGEVHAENNYGECVKYHLAPVWIPCSERLPTAKDQNGWSDWYLCVVENNIGEELWRRCFYDYTRKRWWFGDSPVQNYTVLLWLDMPLPPSPSDGLE